MKKIFLTTVLAILTIFSFASKPHIDNVVVSTENSTIKWIGSKISENHEGTVNIKKGILMIDHGKLVGGQFSIDMQSISTTDMSDKLNKKLDGHLKNEDFFNVEEFPLAIFTINTIQKASGGVNSFEILADLTIKGITHPVTFISTVKIEGLNFSAIAKIKIDRTKWNIKYGSGSFFENLGDKMILDKIEFDISLLSVN
tara:strand:+ start:429 stop:1025 length:597 start_codon:yes stop_codon:yes gene_type:complete